MALVWVQSQSKPRVIFTGPHLMWETKIHKASGQVRYAYLSAWTFFKKGMSTWRERSTLAVREAPRGPGNDYHWQVRRPIRIIGGALLKMASRVI